MIEAIKSKSNWLVWALVAVLVLGLVWWMFGRPAEITSNPIGAEKALAAAEIIRDADGKVIEVRLPGVAKKPPGTPGVVKSSSEIPTGMVGIDGSVITTAALTSLGFGIFQYGPPGESTDGDVATLVLPFESGLMYFTKANTVPSNLLGSRLLFELEAIPGAGFYRLDVRLEDEFQLMQFSIDANEVTLTAADGVNYYSAPVVAGMHKYDMRILPNQTGGTFLIDDVVVATHGPSTHSYHSPAVEITLQGNTGSGFKLDNLSYTPAP